MKHSERKFEGPVAWLVGRQLLGSIKGILLYTAYGKKLDPRDWMLANVFPSTDRGEALKAWRQRRFERESLIAQQQVAAADPALLDQEAEYWRKRGEFWFDYISDTGDGMRATYSIAYLSLGDLYVKSLDPARLMNERNEKDEQPVGTCAHREDGMTAVLPRGEFLFVGGDTAYHVSDYMTLANRIQLPFKWAFQDLETDGGISNEEPNRPLFGIPGNHDYYDQLNGFRRQFRHSVRDEPLRGDAPEIPNPTPEDLFRQAQLFIPGFNRHQQASYTALQLPFGWQLWGLDTEVGQIDERQRKFFHALCEKDPANEEKIIPPKKLIVATCTPTTAFGKLAVPNDGKASDAFRQLGLAQPFLPKTGDPGLDMTGDAQLEAGQCRLDISGDIHHYARYWGPRPVNRKSPVRKGAKAESPAAESYASVISGIGGAFHHPSETYLDEVQEQALYPSEKESTREVAQRIFNPVNIIRGGYVWLAGLVVAFVIYFAFTVPKSSSQVINTFPLIEWLQLAPEEVDPITPTAVAIPSRPEDFPETPVAPFWLWRRIMILIDPDRDPTLRTWEILDCYGTSLVKNPYRYFYGPCSVRWPWDLGLGVLFLLASIVPLLAAVTSKTVFNKERGGESKNVSELYVDPEVYAEPNKWVWPSVVISALLFMLGSMSVEPYRAHITPFGNSMIILFSIIWAATAVALSHRYSEFLFKRSHYAYIGKADWILPWVLTIMSVLSIALSLCWFGGTNLPAFLASDIVFLLVLLGALAALLALPYEVGADLFRPRSRAVRRSEAAIKFYKFLIGLWHAVLQIFVPLILIRMGAYGDWILAAALILVFSLCGAWLLESGSRGLLVAVWILYGGLMLALPYLTARFMGPHQPVFAEGWKGWWGPVPLELVPPLAAGALGAVIACVWFGWYLGVCFAFNGHNNEAGGAARLEMFKQFIRFRLTEEGLTGYVIGIDKPEEHGSELRPRIVDVFQLRIKP